MFHIEKSDEHSHILRLNLAGSPVEWLTWQEATTLYARDLVTWTLGDTLRTVRGGISRMSGQRSMIVLHSIIACEGELQCAHIDFRFAPLCKVGSTVDLMGFVGQMQNTQTQHTHLFLCFSVFHIQSITQPFYLALNIGGTTIRINARHTSEHTRMESHQGRGALPLMFGEVSLQFGAPLFLVETGGIRHRTRHHFSRRTNHSTLRRKQGPQHAVGSQRC
jgi:hypothetical protein